MDKKLLAMLACPVCKGELKLKDVRMGLIKPDLIVGHICVSESVMENMGVQKGCE